MQPYFDDMTMKSVQTMFGFIKFRPAQDDNGS